jgi:hypothetical protein
MAADHQVIYGAIRLLPHLYLTFPPMGPNYDLRSLSIRCRPYISKKGFWKGKEGVGGDGDGSVKMTITLIIGPNKFRIPMFEEGNLDLKGTFQVKIITLFL